jgi:signal transduction histidine kinase
VSLVERETGERGIFLSTLPPGPGDKRLALAVVVFSTGIFLTLAPFAKAPLAQVPAFLPIYQSALVINDLITAVLMYGQHRILRSRALLVLASGYLFSASMAVAHMLSFPGLLAPAGLLGAGGQTTAWLYFLWHGIFPLCVIAYVLLKNAPTIAARAATGLELSASLAVVVVVVSGLVWLTTGGHGVLPAIMQGNQDAPAKVIVATACWTLSLLALAVLWQRRRSLLDLWLMVVMCVWIFDIALASVLNAGRFDVGWYAGRIYGLLAASFVLVVLLLENSVLYARLAEAFEGERRERQRVQEKTDELTAVNRELDAFSYSVSHDLRAPVRAVDGFVKILEAEHGEKLDAEGRRLLGVVRDSSTRMGQLIEDLLAFARLGRQALRTQRVELDGLVNQIFAEVRAGSDSRRIEFTVGKLGATEADPALLKQALANLLSNAIKFTREREPAVIEVGRREEADKGAVFYVKDNGAGFDMRYYDKLFGVFQRLHQADEFEGTGVGLAIVHKVITRHGGRVWAEGAPGAGATFYFTLPAAA